MNRIINDLIYIHPVNKKLLEHIAPPGYHYTGFRNGIYHYSNQINQSTWSELRATDEDLINGNLEIMASNQG